MRSQLGLLGRLLTRNGLIEVFRNAATPIEIRACQGKLISAEGESLRKAKRRNQRLTESDLPYLWLLMPTASVEIRQGFSVVESTVAGVYDFPSLQRIKLIVVHQLEKTEETLLLRLLGREREQHYRSQKWNAFVRAWRKRINRLSGGTVLSELPGGAITLRELQSNRSPSLDYRPFAGKLRVRSHRLPTPALESEGSLWIWCFDYKRRALSKSRFQCDRKLTPTKPSDAIALYMKDVKVRSRLVSWSPEGGCGVDGMDDWLAADG